jgi:hypothetical protein
MVDRLGTAAPAATSIDGGSGAAASKSSDANRAAWMREMEKQEMALWLRHPPGPTEDKSRPGGDTPACPARHEHAEQPGNWKATGSCTEAPGSNVPTAGNASQAGKAHGDGGHDHPASSPQAFRQPVAGEDARPDASAGFTAEEGDIPGPDLPVSMGLFPPLSALCPQFVPEQAGPPLEQNGSGSPAAPGASRAGFPAAVLEVASRAQAGSILANVGTASSETAVGATGARRLADGAADTQQEAKDVDQSQETSLADEQERPSAACSVQDGQAAPAVRVHAFWNDQSVRVWVGTDRSAAMDVQQLAQAAEDLTRLLGRQGAALESLTVNGESVVHNNGDRSGRTEDAGAGPLSGKQIARRARRAQKEK